MLENVKRENFWKTCFAWSICTHIVIYITWRGCISVRSKTGCISVAMEVGELSSFHERQIFRRPLVQEGILGRK